MSLNGAWHHQIRESYLPCSRATHAVWLIMHSLLQSDHTDLLLLFPTALHNAPGDSWPYEESGTWLVKSGRLESKQVVKGGGGCERKKVSPKTFSIRILSTTLCISY